MRDQYIFQKKYVQKWSRFFISNFPKNCMSVYGAAAVQATVIRAAK
jgi:hypothetical protein